jgi:hypothetical protein
LTDLKVVKCDRCGKLLYEGSNTVASIKYIEGRLWDAKEWSESDLCPDCYCTLSLFLIHIKEFDELALKLSDEDAKEDEKE